MRARVRLQKPRIRAEFRAKGRRVMDELALSLSRRGIASLLRHGDRNSMRFSIESRVPFLTTDMVELLLSMPESYLISPEGETKHVFRAAMRGIVPDDVLNRKDKIGFSTPEHEWLLGMTQSVRNLLRIDLELPFFNQKIVMANFEKMISGEIPFSWQIWRWVNFSHWYQDFIASDFN